MALKESIKMWNWIYGTFTEHLYMLRILLEAIGIKD